MLTTSTTLLERLRQPTDQEAWTRFVALYNPLLLGRARRHGLAEVDAADLVQEVLALLLVKLPEFEYRAGGGFRRWLSTVLHHKFLELRRRRQPQPQGDGRDLPLPLVPDVAEEISEKEFLTYLVGRALELMTKDLQP